MKGAEGDIEQREMRKRTEACREGKGGSGQGGQEGSGKGVGGRRNGGRRCSPARGQSCAGSPSGSEFIVRKASREMKAEAMDRRPHMGRRRLLLARVRLACPATFPASKAIRRGSRERSSSPRGSRADRLPRVPIPAPPPAAEWISEPTPRTSTILQRRRPLARSSLQGRRLFRVAVGDPAASRALGARGLRPVGRGPCYRCRGPDADGDTSIPRGTEPPSSPARRKLVKRKTTGFASPADLGRSLSSELPKRRSNFIV